MDIFRRLLDTCGYGGVKCRCCGYKDKRGRIKCRSWTRNIRRALKLQDAREFAKEIASE